MKKLFGDVPEDKKDKGTAAAAPSSSLWVKLYEAPLAGSVRRLKLVSITSCSLTLIYLPLSFFISESNLNVPSKLALSVTVCSFGLITTAALHWATKGYVRSISVSAEDEAKISDKNNENVAITVETVGIYGQLKKSTFPQSAVKYPNEPMAFQSFSVGSIPYFVHNDIVLKNPKLVALFPGIHV